MGRAFHFIAPVTCLLGLSVFALLSLCFSDNDRPSDHEPPQPSSIPSPSYPDAQLQMPKEVHPIKLNFAPQPVSSTKQEVEHDAKSAVDAANHEELASPTIGESIDFGLSIFDQRQLKRLPLIPDAEPILELNASSAEPDQDPLPIDPQPTPAMVNVTPTRVEVEQMVLPSQQAPLPDPNEAVALPEAIDHGFELDESAEIQPLESPTESILNEHPRNESPQNARRAMAVVSRRADQIIEHAISLASRNAPYYARARFLMALRTIVESLDVAEGGAEHVRSLEAGLGALREAEGFVASSPDVSVDVRAIASTHKTPILQSTEEAEVSSVIARQRYYTYAQTKLAESCGSVAAGARALYGLGKLFSIDSFQANDGSMVNGAKAIVFHRAAMIVDPKNYKAANELAVLMGRYGEFETARGLLLHCLAVHRMPEAWYNLSVVHRQLGEADLAKRAEYEYQLTSRGAKGPASSMDQIIRWVDPKTFSSSPNPTTATPPRAANRRHNRN